MTGCVPREVLCALLEEQLDDATRDEVEDHVERCLFCQQRLEELTRRCEFLWLGATLPQSWSVHEAHPSGDQTGGPASNGEMPSTVHLHELNESCSEPELSDEFGPPPQVEGYELISLLGHGGMGVVYKARHRRLGRMVALKMIRPGGGTRLDHLARLRDEAQTLAQLRHPNIVQVYDVGDADGQPFVCLELLEGGSLADRIHSDPQPPQFAAEMIATLASAVHAAHVAGVVHRDLKPTNILFTADGTPKITDFGLAKRIEQEEGHTQTGQVMGSPSYMAPEQAKGRRDVGPLADVYALGAMLYQLLTGRAPFKGATPVETVLQVIHDEPLRPTQLQPRAPRDLETICLRCLQKDPRRRYGSAEELALDLRRFLRGEPIVARPTPLWERAWKWSRRRPGTAAAAGSAVVAAMCVTVSLVLYEKSLYDKRLHAEQMLLQVESARRNQDWEKAEWLLSSLRESIRSQRRLSDLDARVAGLLAENRRQGAHAARKAIQQQRYRDFCQARDRAFERDAEFAAFDRPESLRATREAARDALAVYAPELRSQVQGSGEITDQLPRELTAAQRQTIRDGVYELLLVLAEAVAQPLSEEDAARQARTGLALLERAAQLRPPTRALHQRRADCLARLGKREAAERERKVAEQFRPEGAFEHFLCAQHLYKRRRFAESIQHLEIVLHLHPDHFWANCLLGICSLQEQQPSKAAVIFTSCLRQQPDFWPLHLFRATAYGEEGRILLESAKRLNGAASTAAERAFELAEAEFRLALDRELSEMDRYRVLCSRGLVRLRAGRLNEAAEDLVEATRLRPQSYYPYRTLAQVYRQQGDLDLADQTLSRALEMQPGVADLHRTRAQYALDRPELSPEQLERALADVDRALTLEPNGPSAVEDYTRRGLLLTRARRLEEALAACDKVMSMAPRHVEARRLRVALLLELKRYDEVVQSVNVALEGGHAAAELYEVRGLARASGETRDFHGAIEDYTHALRLQPDSVRLHGLRGWAFLFADAPKLALADFDKVLALHPNHPDGHNGRGLALAQLGRIQEAVEDAQAALRYGDGETRMLYNTARIYAQAATKAEGDLRTRFETCCCEILNKLLAEMPAEQRGPFWRDVVARDEILDRVKDRPEFAQFMETSKPLSKAGSNGAAASTVHQ